MNPSTSSLTKIFYLGLASITLLAAAVQWLPNEGFPPDIDLGPKQASGQSPRPAAPVGVAPVEVPGLAPPTAAAVPSSNPTYPATPYQPQPVVVAPSAVAPQAGQQQPSYSTMPWTPSYAPATPSASSPSMAAPNAANPGAIVPTSSITAPPGSSAILIPTMPAAPVGEPEAQELEATRIVARVGSDVILAGEVTASVNAYLSRNGVNPHDPQIREQKAEFMKMRLKQLIETRTIVNEARRKIPEEGYKKAMQKFDEEFDRTIAPKMARERNLTDVAALEEQLKKDGTTLDREKRNFAEMVLSNSWISQNIHVTADVPHAEMLQYYQQHAAEYEVAGAARWEQIMVRYDAFPSKADAYAALASAGNQLLQGRPFHEVAREVSQGSTAAQGGGQPWTKKGSLVSKPLDRALFELPVGTLSPIIEDDFAFHIVRVIERRDAGRISFIDAQVEIRKKISEQRAEAAKKQMVDDIRSKTEVWTIYDPPQQTASPQSPNAPTYR